MVNLNNLYKNKELLCHEKSNKHVKFTTKMNSYPRQYNQSSHSTIYNSKTMKPNQCITDLINSPNNFKIFHQKVRGLANKTDEFLLPSSDINPIFFV